MLRDLTIARLEAELAALTTTVATLDASLNTANAALAVAHQAARASDARYDVVVAAFEVVAARAPDAAISETTFRTLFERVSEAMMIGDLETMLVEYANPAAVQMFGYSEAEILTMRVPDFIPEASRQAVMAEFDALAEGARVLATDVPLVTKRRSVFHADVGTTRLTIGGHVKLAAFFRDVTNRHEAQGALAASEARYRRLFEAAKDGILILDAGTSEIIDVNPFLLELTGHARDALLGRRLWEIGMFGDVAASKASFAELQTKDYVRHDDHPLVASDGRKLDVELVSNAYGVDGCRVIQCNVRDITVRKRADAERSRLTMAIEQSGESMFVTDALGDIVYVNPAFEDTTGYTRAEVVGHNPRLLKSGKQDAEFYRAIWATVASGKSWRGRLVNRRKDGTLYTQEGTISAVRDAQGEVTSYVAVARDISAALKLEAQFLQAQKMEAVGRLAAGIAHDFNNILCVILSYADMIQDDLEPEVPLRVDIDEIRGAALRATGLTRQLLAFSRQQVLEPKVLRLDQIVVGLEKLLQRLLGEDIECTLLSSPGLWCMRADPGQLEQILMNLAVNARDAMPDGGVLTIETSNVILDDDHTHADHGARVGAYVLLEVGDTGIGMDADTRVRIFEPFFTTKERGKGTGLGLSTVFGIVAQSGGHISVHSEPGGGTVFKLYFPQHEGAAEVVSVTRIPLASDLASETILVVEDDDQLRTVVVDILRRQGYIVFTAPNGTEAMLVFEEHGTTIDLLLTDVVLPRMSGRQLAERLAPIRPGMRVLYMSGYTDDVVLQHGILNAEVPYLQKPFTSATLVEKVREVVCARPSRYASLVT